MYPSFAKFFWLIHTKLNVIIIMLSFFIVLDIKQALFRAINLPFK